MKSAKKTDTVPGDIPAPILKEFLPELAAPITAIIQRRGAESRNPRNPGSRTILILTDNLSQENAHKCGNH
jgi:hypothetical protein